MHVSGHTGTIRSSVTAHMHLIDERYFLYRYRIVIVGSLTGPFHHPSFLGREGMMGN